MSNAVILLKLAPLLNIKLSVLHPFYGPNPTVTLILLISVGKTLISPSKATHLRVVSDSSKCFILFFIFLFNLANILLLSLHLDLHFS